jgi:alpha-1,4-digalacturonate transport system permease protein
MDERASATGVMAFLTRRRGRARLDWTDWLSYAYLALGVILMLGPVLWVGLSSLKTAAAITEFPPTLLPYGQLQVRVPGYAEPLPLYEVRGRDGSTRRLAQVRRIGLEAHMVDPTQPAGAVVRVPLRQRTPVRGFDVATENYSDLWSRRAGNFRFARYLGNSVFVTVAATLLTLLINAMAAFALSKYRFRGRSAMLVLVLSTIMLPSTVLLVPIFLIVAELGLVGSLWGVIFPTIATPTGVFMLRQYMLSIPDELLDAARLDHASEWRIFWRIVVPLAAPALAVLAVFSTVWRWNDFLLPLVILDREEVFTLQLALNAFQGENVVQWNYLLAMTVIAIVPVALVFTFLQRFITAGIATTGIK